MGHPELETVDGRRRMRQHPYKSTETGSQACITEKAGDCIVKAETPFERNVIDGIKTIIELLEKSQRTKSISDIFKT